MVQQSIKAVVSGDWSTLSGIIILGLLYVVVEMVKAKGRSKGNGNGHTKLDDALEKLTKLESNLDTVKTDMAWLREAHDVKDEDGVYAWYVRKSLGDSVKALSDAVSSLNMFMKDIHGTNKQQIKILEQLVDKVSKK